MLDGNRDVLLVGLDPTWFTVDRDPVRELRTSVLNVPSVEHALGAMRSGYQPDVVVVDLLTTDTGALWDLLRRLFEEETWRVVPVLLGGPGGSECRTLFQIAPRHRHRRLPCPSDPKLMVALLHFVASEADRDRQSLAPVE